MLTQLIKGGYSGGEIVFYILVFVFALTLSFAFHEFMHAFVAHLLGDDTAKNMGRVTLNPLAHVDPIGTVLILFIGFGWGKPVPVNPNRLTRFKSKRLMSIMVSLAGVTGNFILAFISCVIYTIMAYKIDLDAYPLLFCIAQIFAYTFVFSMGLLAFNLLPIPPLDGFHVIEELLPYKIRYTDGYKKFSMIAPRVLLGIIMLGSITGVNVLSKLIDIIEAPFMVLIELMMTPIYLLLGGV